MEIFYGISSRNDLADALNIPRKKLTHILYIVKVDKYYKSFDIPKKSGGTRHIHAPTGDLKELQRKLASLLWEYQQEIWAKEDIHPNIAHAFIKNKSIMTNADVHKNKKFLINIDLENFFDSFHFGRVCGFFEKNRYYRLPKDLAIILAQLTCFDGHLPQGAPTSPIITNLICQIFDYRVIKLAKKYKLDYTRYADDLSFSTNVKDFPEKYNDFYKELNEEIIKSGFRINASKTRFAYKDSRHIVTGLVVNKKVNVDRRYYKTVRATAHNMYVGNDSQDDIRTTLRRLDGCFSFINQIDEYTNEPKKVNYHNLKGKEKEYQKFLFYRYFFANEKPLIVCEGKTDIVYLKSALKKMYLDYPMLIRKNEDGSFIFNIYFLRKTKRLNQFLGIAQDGADAMNAIYNFYVGDCVDNYYDLFSKKYGGHPTNPIILLFDNEISNNKKPIYKFLKHSKISETEKQALKETLYLKVLDNSNIFLLTNPLVKGKSECEIEDLFDDTILNKKIDGKTFSLDASYDINLFYGKEIFSRYIQSNYKSLDFENFRRIFDNINRIIDDYSKQID